MTVAELPHSADCIVCGRQNPHGLGLSLHVDLTSGQVSSHFTPALHHTGFEGIIHGGVLATVLDEAMVWAATWAGRRFCVCGEMNVRFRQSAKVSMPLRVKARVVSSRSRLLETESEIETESGTTIATATGKYVPVPPDRNRDVIETLLPEPTVSEALGILRNGKE